MESVLLSTRPQWVGKITTGIKTTEVRKTRPKINTPFKCYIYETKAKKHFYSYIEACECPSENDRISFWEYGSGKIIGEFICDKIERFDLPMPAYFSEVSNNVKELLEKACLSMSEAYHYIGDKDGYGWHISDLKIYDNPRELKEFNLTRPPQSWCYVKGA